MAKLIAGSGGDIIKFAGDAMIVLWPDESDGAGDLETRCQRAAQAAARRPSGDYRVPVGPFCTSLSN